jgi:multisubunit Na+/H+ antiporter MnhG subunit
VAWPLLLIFVFHVLDALFTLAHLERGGRELNPFMSRLIAWGPGVFLGTKLALAAAGLLFLGLHQNFPHVRKGIALLFVVYLGVLLYHLLLLARALGFPG